MLVHQFGGVVMRIYDGYTLTWIVSCHDNAASQYVTSLLLSLHLCSPSFYLRLGFDPFETVVSRLLTLLCRDQVEA